MLIKVGDPVWIVGSMRHHRTGGAATRSWTLHAIMLDEGDAVEMCKDHHYFVAPLPFGQFNSYEVPDWEGIYWPHAGDV